MRSWRAWSLASAAVAGLTTAVYVGVIVSQGDSSWGDVLPWVTLMGLGTAAAAWSALSRSTSVGRRAAIGAAVVLGGVGVLGILSIGIGFLAAAVLAAVAAARAAQPAT